MKEIEKQKKINDTLISAKRTAGADFEYGKRTSTKGITVIALVITIVVLLILAGVALNLTLGRNGILTKANEAREQKEIADTIEKARIDILEVQTENQRADITKKQFVEILENYFNSVPEEKKLPEDLSTLILKTKAEYGGHDIKISDIWNGKFAKEEQKALAKDVLVTDETSEELAKKSPYVVYNGLNCRVLYNDDIRGIQIVSSGCVDSYILGPENNDTEVPSAGPGFWSVDVKRSVGSFNAFKENLDKKAQAFLDQKGIARDARSIGSNPKVDASGRFTKKSDPEGLMNVWGWSEYINYINLNNTEDLYTLKKLGILDNGEDYWFTKAYSTVESDSVLMTASYAEPGKDYLSSWMTALYPQEVDVGVFIPDPHGKPMSIQAGVRAVFLLEPSVEIQRGDGSQGNPYIIE